LWRRSFSSPNSFALSALILRRELLDADQPDVLALIADADDDRAGRAARQAVGPFHGGHTRVGNIWVETDLIEIGAVEPVEIDMYERQTSARVLVDERERGTRDLVWVNPEASRQSFHKGGFPRSQVTGEQQHGARREFRRQLRGTLTRFFFRARREFLIRDN
jgi:hypothetical protein